MVKKISFAEKPREKTGNRKEITLKLINKQYHKIPEALSENTADKEDYHRKDKFGRCILYPFLCHSLQLKLFFYLQ